MSQAVRKPSSFSEGMKQSPHAGSPRRPASVSAVLPLPSSVFFGGLLPGRASQGQTQGTAPKPKGKQSQQKVVEGKEKGTARAGKAAGWRASSCIQPGSAPSAVAHSRPDSARILRGASALNSRSARLQSPFHILGQRDRARSPVRLNYSSLICPQLPPFHTGNASSPGA